MRFGRLERRGVEFFLPTSPPICQAFADDPLRGLRHALIVADAKRDALVVSEIELAKVALQMLLAHVVIRPGDPAL